ncbi:MAG: hypothetical protein JW712_04330 [Dehalococcoidales bacterium]|nr:hypothetical protein [Dehalococcoidales bacterium]
MNYKQLCMDLVKCETETEVIDVLKNSNYWNNESCWRYFGDIEDNYSTIGNQQEKPEYALVEKIINSVDAVLMNKCFEMSIDPKSKDAPQSVKQAQIKFFGIPDGKLSKLYFRQRSELAENICIVATGSKSNPCYSIIDRGEGQTPDTMPSTLLGLFRSIKNEIPFVQGKFHMGGTGALRFCGEDNIQLVISKRNPNICDNPKENQWGFAIVRKEKPKGGRRTSVYRYLAPNGKILRFSSDTLPLLPGNYPNTTGKDLSFGTFIKLYEYDIGNLKTNILFDLYNALSLLVPNIALPIRLYERRPGYSGHTFDTTLSGLSVRLDQDRKQNLEDGFPSSHPISCLGQKLNVQVYAFKPGQSTNYRRKEGIIFTVNGQTHGHIPLTFFQRESIGMGYLRDSILIIVDCTDLEDSLKEKLFMNSRDRLSAGQLANELERQLTQLVKEHPGLRELKDKRRQAEIKDKLEESKPLAEVLASVIKNSPTLAQLLLKGGKISNPFQSKEIGTGDTYQGEKYPTYFRLKKKSKKELLKECPINWRFRVQFETDACNDYFERDDDPGVFELFANGIDVSDYSLSLWNGTANLTVDLPKGVKPHNILKYDSRVKDYTKWQPFEDSFTVIVKPNKKHNKGGDPPPPPPPPGDNGNGKKKSTTLTIPQVTDVYKDDWEHHDFDEFDALNVISLGDGIYDYYVNIDNICLQTEMKHAKPSTDIELIVAQFRYAVVLIGMSVIRELSESKNQKENMSESIPDRVKFFTRAVSPILIPMITSLSQLEPNEYEVVDTVAL